MVWVLLGAGTLAGLCQAPRALSPAPADSEDDQQCAACHKDTAAYLRTGHWHTSAPASREGLDALVRQAGTTLSITVEPLPVLRFVLAQHEGKYQEIAETGWAGNLAQQAEPVDLVTGSGRHGQTFLYWAGDRLFELPMSYWSEGHRWINSPGYVDGTADFMRPVQPGCLECHATAAVPVTSEASTNRYEPGSLVTGLHCSTCHGPGAAHIAAETAAAAAGRKAASAAILNPAHFSRDRQLDLCALCHSGTQRAPLQPAFSYRPGEELARFYQALPTASDARPDVHGNQVGLLEMSACFRRSSGMTCSTCHDVHSEEQTPAAYAQRCQSCHTWQSCGESHRLGVAIREQCIRCHMPLQKTRSIVSTTAGAEVQATLRTHWIRVYTANERAAADPGRATPAPSDALSASVWK